MRVGRSSTDSTNFAFSVCKRFCDVGRAVVGAGLGLVGFNI